MTLSLVLSLSRPNRCAGDARDIMQGEPDVDGRGPGSLTPFLRPGRSRPFPDMFLIRSPTPLARDGPGESLVEPLAPPQGPAGDGA